MLHHKSHWLGENVELIEFSGCSVSWGGGDVGCGDITLPMFH